MANRFCKDCKHLDGATCARPTGIKNPVTGDDFVAGLDAQFERGNESYALPLLAGKAIDLCGPDARFFE